MRFQTIILQGGEDIEKRENGSLIRKIRENSETGKILVIPWTSDLPENEEKHMKTMEQYFTDCGFNSVSFLERDRKDLERLFSEVDVLYLPSGDPEILQREIEDRNLQPLIDNFKGTVIGNSAGAIVLSKGTYTRGRFYPGFGFLDFYVNVHFDLDDSGNYAGNPIGGEMTVGIPEGGWISVKRKIPAV